MNSTQDENPLFHTDDQHPDVGKLLSRCREGNEDTATALYLRLASPATRPVRILAYPNDRLFHNPFNFGEEVDVGQYLFRSKTILLGPGRNIRLTIDIDFNSDQIGMATDWAVFHVLLIPTGRNINGNNDFFATAVANVMAVVVHGLSVCYC